MRFGHLISKYKKPYRNRIPTIFDESGNALMISGYLFPPGGDDADAYRRLLSLCMETHGKVLEECEGEFVCLFAEARSGTLHIVNDRFGACPFFVLKAGDRTFYSSNLAFLHFLVDGRLESDVLGWLQIFTWDHAVGSRTHLRAVTRLLPASHVILSPDGTRQHQYWRLRHQVDEHSVPADTSMRVFDAFRQATQRRAERLKRGIIALSGGLDSRLLAGALPEGADFSAFTFADSMETTDTPEVRAALEISKILGIRHTIKPIPNTALSPQLATDIVALTGGLIAVHHSAKTMQCISAMKSLGVDCQMGAGPADALAGSKIPSPEFLDPSRAEECVLAYCQKVKFGTDQPTLLGRLFRRDVLREYYPRLAPSLMESFETLEGPTAAHRVTAWSLAYREFGFTFACPTHSHPDVTEAQPHLGYDYADLMLRLPAAWLYKKAFYKFMIFQCLPRLREVAHGTTGERLSRQLVSFNPEDSRWRGYYRSARAFVGRTLRASVRSQRRGKVFAYDLLKHNPQLLSEVAEIVHSRHSLGEILDVERCTQFLNGCRVGDIQGSSHEEDAHLLGTLATMSYVFERFDV